MTAPGMPRPLPDELLYSVIARSARHLGHWSPKGLSGAVYGRRTLLPSADLPGWLTLLENVARDAWGLTIEQLAARHTLIGYYTHFLGESACRDSIAAMAGASSHLHLRLGICAGTARDPSRFRLCPQCAREDIQRYGETYWRRSHHVPGALVCVHHGVSLHETGVPFRPVGRHEHIAAMPSMLTRGSNPLLPAGADAQMALVLAADCAALLDAPSQPDCPLHDYRPALERLGFRGHHGGHARFREAFEAFVGRDAIEALFKAGAKGGPLRWLEEVRRKPRRALHPLQHVLLRRFLAAVEAPAQGPKVQARDGKPWGLYRSVSLRRHAAALAQQGLSTRAVAKALAVDWKTAYRLLAPLPTPALRLERDVSDRLAWLALTEANEGCSRNELRKRERALYARLYRADREWLLQHGPERAQPRGGRQRVDWGARDRTLAARIASEIERTVAWFPLTRASRHRVLGALGLRALIAHYAAKLPRSVATLEAMCETVEAFQVRRLATVTFSSGGNHPVPAWLALRRARINPARSLDGGRLLLQAALRFHAARREERA